MSWSGFKKNVGRATTQVMMKTGHVEKTTDREYEVEERRYRTLESASLRLQKEAKGYLDSLRAMTASQMRIAETIDAFYGDSGATDGVSRSYKQAVEDLDAETVKALDGPYRCVTQEPDILDMVLFDEERGLYNYGMLAEIEAELNFTNGKRRNYTRGLSGQELEGACQLIESIYRTTVLEPINRFCAYFPDINECIKKRNHKMLDYDAMRSKVRKLVEKPDKDPSKLPRTEKETEMVMTASTLFRTSRLFDALSESPPHHDLSITSPPKALDGLKHNKDLDRIVADEEAAMRSVGLRRSSSILDRVSRVGSLVRKSLGRSSSNDAPSESGSEDRLLHPPSSPAKPRQPSWSSYRSSSFNMPAVKEASPEASTSPVLPDSPTLPDAARLKHHRNTMRQLTANEPPTARHISMPVRPKRLGQQPPRTCTPTPSSRFQDQRASSSLRVRHRSGTTDSDKTIKASVGSTLPRNRADPSPFFQPSELEEIMQPFKEKFLQERTDELLQAKAAYEQLNQQLTDELPQLIDLRVPYLDPSFEALVKVQLRFSAEAYSRMAQVQQYLDASTRDQYASGDLDARVEDVLGQIRELSIAGTV